MELYQLRYFVEFVRRGGLYPAAAALHVSPPAVSRALTSLEENLATKLFFRSGRKLEISAEGQVFFERAERILMAVDDCQSLFRGTQTIPEIVIAGREVLLSEFALQSTSLLRKKYPESVLRLINASGEEALQKVQSGEAHAAIVIQKSPTGWGERVLADLTFVSCVGGNHPLVKSRKVGINEMLAYPFVSPASAIFGRSHKKGSADLWRDDVHPRKIGFVVDSLELFALLIARGEAIGYVPDYWAKRHKFKILTVSGCGFAVEQSVRICTRLHRDVMWLNHLLKS